MREMLYKTSYNSGLNSFVVEKATTESTISIEIYKVKGDHKTEIGNIHFQNIGEEYVSPYLNWYNLIFCSNSYGPAPDYEYMNCAVQEGKKTAATIYMNAQSDEGKQLISSLPPDCSALPYGENMIYVFHKGRLGAFFDFDRIKSLYEKHGVFNLDWRKISELFQKDLSYFADEKKCGFSLQSGGCRAEMIVTGLLLGYPIESTVALL